MHDSAQALRGKKLLLVGFTLFSMFFGAGNLIFPPFLGAQAGTALWLAFVGFAVSAIGLPIAGVAAVARAGGLPALAGRVHPRFAQVFAVLVYLSIGPCLAIPRTASTSFEMLTPLVGRSTPGQFIYSLVFFAAAYFVALKPEKLTQRLGRILCPALLVLIVVLFAGCILRPAAPGYGTPAEAYAALPAAQGVLDGYQTMDALAALNFGAVIALNIQAVGITEEAAVRRGTIRAGLIAGGMLLVVYAMLTHIGGISGASGNTLTIENFADDMICFWTNDEAKTIGKYDTITANTADGTTYGKGELTLVKGTLDGKDVYFLNRINVPEPAEWAAIFGGIALALALYRRRR